MEIPLGLAFPWSNIFQYLETPLATCIVANKLDSHSLDCALQKLFDYSNLICLMSSGFGSNDKYLY